MIRVIVESPYNAKNEDGSPDWDGIEKNLQYLRAAMRDCLTRGEAPYASHALYTQKGVLDDFNDFERRFGIHAGFAWRQCASKTVIYQDLGISSGMKYGIEHAEELGHEIEYRNLAGWSDSNI